MRTGDLLPGSLFLWVVLRQFSGALATGDDGDDDTGDDTDDEDIPASKQSAVQVLRREGDILSGYHEVWGR